MSNLRKYFAVVTQKKILKISLISLLVICVTILHYRTDHLQISSHILFRELYFPPIILAGFWFGMKGALPSSLTVTFLYLTYVFSHPVGIAGHNFGNSMQVILFNVIGLLIGWLRDRERIQQRKILETENLAAMGRAVSCIAHDMKTPLMAIGGFVRQVRRKVSEDSLANKLDVAFEQVQRLEVLVSDMLAFAKPLNLQCQQGKINDLIEEVVMLAGEKAARHSVTIVTELQEDMPGTLYDQHRLQQALLNLINNALEASLSGEKVIVRGQCNGSSIIIEIIDRGEGIPKELQDDIFTPFVTTKKEGTGLGLPIVKKVIEAHEGSIELYKNTEKGMTSRITIPVAATECG
jgi:signal transduction histidine kinase